MWQLQMRSTLSAPTRMRRFIAYWRGRSRRLMDRSPRYSRASQGAAVDLTRSRVRNGSGSVPTSSPVSAARRPGRRLSCVGAAKNVSPQTAPSQFPHVSLPVTGGKDQVREQAALNRHSLCRRYVHLSSGKGEPQLDAGLLRLAAVVSDGMFFPEGYPVRLIEF